jgi:hypothetical protein
MLEGDSWKEAKMDKAKIDKMSGEFYGLVQRHTLTGSQTNKLVSSMSSCNRSRTKLRKMLMPKKSA